MGLQESTPYREEGRDGARIGIVDVTLGASVAHHAKADSADRSGQSDCRDPLLPPP